MSLGLLFWILMILWFLFGFMWLWPHSPESPTAFGSAFYPLGGHILIFILLFILGWRVFGFVIQG